MRQIGFSRFGWLAWETLLIAGIVFICPKCGEIRGGETGDIAAARKLVEHAMRAEASGDATGRSALLREAIELAPDYPLARWLSGEIQVSGAWTPIHLAELAATTDPRLIEYRQIRAATGDSPDAHLALARWCRKKNLDDEARFHWALVLAFHPDHEEALLALGMRWFHGRLLTHAQVGQLKKELQSANKAARRWTPQVARWERDVRKEDSAPREQALSNFRALENPNAIPAVENTTLSTIRTTERRAEVQRVISLAFLDALESMPEHAATQSLVRHAVLSPFSDVRKQAADKLASRSPHDFIPSLLDAMEAPIETWVSVTTDSDGSVHYSHALIRKGPFADWTDTRTRSLVQHNLWDHVPSDPRAGAARVRRPASVAVVSNASAIASHSIARFEEQAAAIDQEVAEQNKRTVERNARIAETLAQVTGQKFGAEPRRWWDWWRGYNELYAPETRPEFRTTDVAAQHYFHPALRRRGGSRGVAAAPPASGTTIQQPTFTCFAPETPVWTKTGLRPIASLRLGDFVLAQDVSSGELAYRPVLGVTIRPPTQIQRLQIGGGHVDATAGHPIWVSGAGWKMAKQLEEGAYVHGLHGPAAFYNSEPAYESNAYNLIVAEFHTYFVGEEGLLVHDNTPRRPSSATVPGWRFAGDATFP